jgi:hypothetical protein
MKCLAFTGCSDLGIMYIKCFVLLLSINSMYIGNYLSTGKMQCLAFTGCFDLGIMYIKCFVLLLSIYCILASCYIR